MSDETEATPLGRHAGCGGEVLSTHMGDRRVLICTKCQQPLTDAAEVLHPARVANTPMRRLLSDGPERVAVVLALLLILAVPAQAQTKPAWPTQLALGSYLVLGSIDIAQTSACVARGTCVEANPVMRPLVQGPGIATAAAVKGAASVGITYGLLKLRRTHPKAAWWTAVAVAVAQAAIVVRNARVIR